MKTFRTAAAFAAGLTLVLGLAPGRHPAHALEFTADCTVASLKAQIEATNGSPGADILNLPASCTYTLSTVDNTAGNGPNGLPIITGELIIDGNNSSIVRSDETGTPEFRILSSSSGKLTLNHLEVNNGAVDVSAAAGGGVYTADDFAANYSVFRFNKVTGDFSGQGGAIWAGGTANLFYTTLWTNSVVLDDEASGAGGAAYSVGDMTLNNTSGYFSSVSGGVNARGGALSTAGTLSIFGGLFIQNSTTGKFALGGAAESTGAADVTSSKFEGNTATATSTETNEGFAEGGAVTSTTSISIGASYVLDNSATGQHRAEGGALASSGNVTTVGTTFSGNEAESSEGTAEGGAINSGMSVTTMNSTFYGNVATGSSASDGGAILASDFITTSNATISGNSALGTVSAAGGGVAAVGGGLILKNSIISLNTSAGTNGDCFSGNLMTAGSDNLDSDGTCGGAITAADPGLLPLIINPPGNIRTMALAVGSPARGIGSVCEFSDQTGYPRPFGDPCDAGAWEARDVPFDVDCDGDSDAVDALAALTDLAGFEFAEGSGIVVPMAPCTADVDGTEGVDMRDVIAIRKFLVANQ